VHRTSSELDGQGAQAEAARRMGLSGSTLAYELTNYGILLVESRQDVRVAFGGKNVLGKVRRLL